MCTSVKVITWGRKRKAITCRNKFILSLHIFLSVALGRLKRSTRIMRSRFVWLEQFLGTVAYPDISSSIFDGSEEVQRQAARACTCSTPGLNVLCAPALEKRLRYTTVLMACSNNTYLERISHCFLLRWLNTTELERMQGLHNFISTCTHFLIRLWSERRQLFMDMYNWALRFDEMQVVYNNSFK